jgi:hypothetical protein
MVGNRKWGPLKKAPAAFLMLSLMGNSHKALENFFDRGKLTH